MIAKQLWKVMCLLMVVTLMAACNPATPAPQPTAAPAQPTAAPAQPTAAPVQPTAAPAGNKVPVGIVLPTKDEPRWIQDETRFKDALSKAGYEVQILFSQGDSAKEKANVEALISQGIKVLIICPQDGTAAAAAADEARAAGVKVISYDRLIRDTDAVDYYVTFDSVAVGAAWGDYLVSKASGQGNNLYLYAGAASDNNAFLFFQGAWSKLQPKIADGTFVIKNSSEAVALQAKAELTRDEEAKIIGQVSTNWDFNTAKNLAESNLTAAAVADKGTVFIAAPNDGTARAIADAFAADKDVKTYYVTGQDAEKASVQYIIDGKQSMTVLKDVRTLVADAITAAVAYLKGGTPEKTNTYNNGKIDVPAKPSAIVTVTKDNVQAALIDSGYYQASDFTGLGAAAPAATAAPAALTIPDIQPDKFNVAVVLVGFHADGGWSQAHTEGAQWMSTQDPTIAIAYLDTVFPGPDAESAMRSLARKGFDLIIGTTFEYGPTMDTLAEEFPKVNWLHVSGYRNNGKNYGNLFGAMEDMKYLAGMVAGARAKADNNTKIGYVAPWPLPEVIRLGNAFMLGAKVTCPECTMEVRWINTWYDPDKEKQAAQSLLDAGVDIVLIGSDTPGPLVAAANAGKWAFTYDYINSCQPAPEKCLGTPYWNWGPSYLNVVKEIRAGTWKPGDSFLDADSGIVGFYGFMPGQTPQPGVPKDVIPLVQAKLADMVAGKFTVQDVFKGPIKDNTGKVIVPDGQSLTVDDLFGIDAATIKSGNLTGRTACTYCMNWLVDGIQGTIPAMP